MLVSQSYNIFNRFGKDSNALKDMTRAFIEDLTEYSEDQITNAFKSWRRQSSGMPTPANIIDSINTVISTKKASHKKFSEWQMNPEQGYEKNWSGFKDYLEDNGLLSENFTRSGRTLTLRQGYYPEWTLKDFN